MATATSKKKDRTLTDRVQDLPHAVLGAGDAAVAFVRDLPGQLTRLPEDLRGRFDGLAERGRTLRTQIERSPSMKRAEQQTSTAKSKAKAAVTSASKAAGAQAKAAKRSAEKVG